VIGQIQALEINAFFGAGEHLTDAFRSDAIVRTNAHFAPNNALFLSLSPCRSDYPPPRPIGEKLVKNNKLREWPLFSENRSSGVANVTGIEIEQTDAEEWAFAFAKARFSPFRAEPIQHQPKELS